MDADDERQARDVLDGWANREPSLQSPLGEYPSRTARTSHLIGKLDAVLTAVSSIAVVVAGRPKRHSRPQNDADPAR